MPPKILGGKQSEPPADFLMETSKNLEIQGSLQTVALAELLCEIAQNQFNGSLRLANESQKTVIYFDDGKLIFAVSNARQHRLFQMLLQAGKINQDGLLAITDFTNDLALKDYLLKNNLLNQTELDQFFARQIAEILQTALAWQTGEWIFSPLVRVKNDLRFEVDVHKLFFDYARRLNPDQAAQKLKNPNESFSAVLPMPDKIELSPHEWFVHSRLENSALSPGEIQNMSGLPNNETARILYTLWLGGFLKRRDFHAAFSEKYVAAVVSAKLAVKKEEAKPEAAPTAAKAAAPVIKNVPVEKAEPSPEENPTPSEQPIALEDYLVRVENAANNYEFFGLMPDVSAPEIKKTYFGLAKRFHPDLFRKEAQADLRQRIENAFSKLAQAYDTLKDESSREVYDFKMRKEIAEMMERQKKGETVEETAVQKQVDEAGENFDQGFNYLMDEDYEAALPYLARAVFYAKENARYHAYYGKALSADESQSHRAEAELQTAVKLDGKNADYRIMLAEFFIEIGLVKRAEGELNRLLAMAPSNYEARMLLDRLKRK